MSKALSVFLICFIFFQANAVRMAHLAPLTIQAASVPAIAEALEKADKSATDLKIAIARVILILFRVQLS